MKKTKKNYSNNIVCYGLVSLFMFSFACSHRVFIEPESLKKNQVMQIELQNGDKIDGLVIGLGGESVAIQNEKGVEQRIQMSEIKSVKGPEPVLDAYGQIITETEIKSVKQNKNLKSYSISGGLISLGLSFFTSAMISRQQDEDKRDAVIYGGTAAGTVVGTSIFAILGARKDRQDAINNLILSRQGVRPEEEWKGIRNELEVREEIEKLKEEHDRQQEEIKKLQQQIKTPKEITETEE